MDDRLKRKIWNAWAFYDWANSVYPLVVTSAIFPIFYATLFHIKGSDYVELFGYDIKNTALISFVSALGFLIVSFISPILSGIADYVGNKKSFMKLFCYVGALACISLYWFSLENIYLSIMSYLIALVGFWGSLVFYNSYLPDIAPREKQDALSAKGYALGYIGSVILLIISLALIMKPYLFGISGSEGEASIKAMRLSFVGVGLWWIGFSQISYFWLPRGRLKKNETRNYIFNGFKELKTVYHSLSHNRVLKKYLLSFFVYSMAVQTVMLIATYFGEQEITWGTDSKKTMGLIVSILLIQIIAVGGAILTSKAAKTFGNFRVLIALNLMWAVTCVYAFYITTPFQFYIAALAVGLVMGGIQSLSRSTYSKMLDPHIDTTSFFSFYDVVEKLGIVIGMAIFGIVDQITGSTRNSVLFLVLFFLIGIGLLLKTYFYEKKTHKNL